MRILNRSPNGALSQTHMANTRKLHLLVIFDAAAAAPEEGGAGVVKIDLSGKLKGIEARPLSFILPPKYP
jgi:hypothetical protein